MKPSNTSTLAVLLLNLSCINAFAPPPELNSWKVVNRAAHPPHKNFYLEQLAASPTKEEAKVEASPTEIKTSMETTTSEEPEEEQDKTKSLLAKVKQAGTAGAISYALWELGAQQILPILLRMQLFQNSNEIFSWFQQQIRAFHAN